MGHGRQRYQAAANRKRIVKKAMEARANSRSFTDYRDLVRERLSEEEPDDDATALRSMRGSKGAEEED